MQFIESIRFEHGQFHLLDLHQARIDRTFASFYPGMQPLSLQRILPAFAEKGKFKFRLQYNATDHDVSWQSYQPKQITSLRLVDVGQYDYAFKFTDRAAIDEWVATSVADDVLFIKNGLLTDASYANIALYDGNTWHTPKMPLLNGVKRQHLLSSGELLEKDIRPADLNQFQKISLINAMLDLQMIEISIDNLLRE